MKKLWKEGRWVERKSCTEKGDKWLEVEEIFEDLTDLSGARKKVKKG